MPEDSSASQSEVTPDRRRQRATRRSGRRAQLTVPSAMWEQVAGIARTAGTTPNDMLVRLVAERLEDRMRALALQRRADERWRSFADAPAATRGATEPLSEGELVELSGAFRTDIGE